MREKNLERERVAVGEETRETVRYRGYGRVRDVRKVNGQADERDWKEARRQWTEQPSFRTDVARNYYYYEKEKGRTTYFFTIFPENFKAKHMLKAFLNYGDFEEVVIPAKRDRRGCRFGFARAVGVEDPEYFAVKLDNIVIGRDKILVNMPRFEREGKKERTAVKRHGKGVAEEHKPPDKQIYKPSTSHHRHRSYAEAVKFPKIANIENQKPETVSKPNVESPNLSHPRTLLTHKQRAQKRKHGYIPPPRPKKPWAHRTYEVEDELVQKLRNAYVGIVNRPGLSYRMHEEFAQEGYFALKTTPMGANKVLLESSVEGEIEALIKDASDWLAVWFKDIRKWSPGEVDDEPLTWLKVYGVPIHAWNEDFFMYIVSWTGEYGIIDENTEKKNSLDVARILIRRKRYDVINFVERIEINGELFIIKVVEDWYAPQWFSHNQPKSDAVTSSTDSDSFEEESDMEADRLYFNYNENDDDNQDEEEDFEVDGDATGGDKAVTDAHVEEEKVDGEKQEAMMSGMENTGNMMAGKFCRPSVGIIENTIMENLGIGGEGISNTVLTSCENGIKEKVNFSNCNNMENVNVEGRKIS